jgi:hypothetical protein
MPPDCSHTLPFSILVDGWSTNYNLAGEAFKIGDPGKVGVYTGANGNPNMFRNSTDSRVRCTLRTPSVIPTPARADSATNCAAPGYFGIDTGLSKRWSITEQQQLQFPWEVFSVTNAVRFDAAASSNNFDLSSGGFGVYSSTLTKPA